MDSLKNQPGPAMKAWRIFFGGDQIVGRLKLFLFLAAFLVLGGVLSAYAAG